MCPKRSGHHDQRRQATLKCRDPVTAEALPNHCAQREDEVRTINQRSSMWDAPTMVVWQLPTDSRVTSALPI